MYEHVPQTCYVPSYYHEKFPEWEDDIMGRKFVDIKREYHHKFDPIKTYNEEMLKLKTFAPQPIQAVKKTLIP